MPEQGAKISGLWLCLSARKNPFQSDAVFTYEKFEADLDKALGQIRQTVVAHVRNRVQGIDREKA